MSQQLTTLRLGSLLLQAQEMGASDIHIQAGSAPVFRVSGALRVQHSATVTDEALKSLIQGMLDARQLRVLEEQKWLRWVHWDESNGRIRCHVANWSGGTSLTLRPLSDTPQQMAKLGWDSRVLELLQGQGLVLLTGESGSGVSTTMTSLIDLLNVTFRQHILCLERDLETLHFYKLSMVNQRSLGLDFDCWSQAIRAACRQEVDTLVLHDAPIMDLWGELSEFLDSGAMVIANTRARSIRQALETVIDSHAPAEQQRVQLQLSRHLAGATHQRLVAGHMASSFLLSTLGIGNLIREGKFHQLIRAMDSSPWCQTLEKSLCDLVRSELITRETGLAASEAPMELERLLDE